MHRGAHTAPSAVCVDDGSIGCGDGDGFYQRGKALRQQCPYGDGYCNLPMAVAAMAFP
jgi:hypothetical protein